MRYAMVMAGGVGTRLWPMSRQERPKQLLPFIDGRSLLEVAARRVEGLVAPDRRLICTGERYRDAVRQALPDFDDEQILGEPVGRNTINAVGFTAAVLAARDPDAVFAVLTADHVIEPEDEFRRALDLGFRLVEDDPSRLVTFGIESTFPATGYGWVHRGEVIPRFDGSYAARGFDEKPELAVATSYHADATWGWNSGMFVYQARQFMEALAWFKPASHDGLQKIAAAWDTASRGEVLASVYPTLPSDSVDFGVMEPAAGDERLTICCVPMQVSWRDIGSWPSYGETLAADADGNRTNARTTHIDSRNVLATSDDPNHVITTIGCDDLVIVRTADATLVCRADRAQDVKTLVDALPESLR